MINLRKALVASALALCIALPAGTPVFADSGSTACPTISQTFPFVLPTGLIPGVTGSGSLILSAESGQNGVCSGTFTAVVGGTPVAAGAFTAIHRGSTVTVFFQTASGSTISARGFVFYDSATGQGIIATKLSVAGQCKIVVAQFAGSPSTGFAIVGTPLVLPCF